MVARFDRSGRDTGSMFKVDITRPVSEEGIVAQRDTDGRGATREWPLGLIPLGSLPFHQIGSRVHERIKPCSTRCSVTAASEWWSGTNDGFTYSEVDNDTG